VVKKSRFVLALAMTIALAFAGMAFGDGASENQAFVDGKVTPKKLDKKKYKPVNLFLGVRTEANVNGQQKNPKAEYISVGKNVKLDLNATPVCTNLPPNGSTPQQARDACPEDSYWGGGEAAVQFPPPAGAITDVVVSVFHGPGQNGVQLHTYSPTLGQASPTVLGTIQKSKEGAPYGQALSVPNAPETGSGMITKFNATVERSSKVALARCKAKKIPFQREVTYSDGSKETADLVQKCKRKGG
jgi:hypothetical protein